VRVLIEPLTPGVQHAEEADLGAEMLWVGGHFEQRFRRGSEQQRLQRPLVLQHERRKLSRTGKWCWLRMNVLRAILLSGHRSFPSLPLRHGFRKACHDPFLFAGPLKLNPPLNPETAEEQATRRVFGPYGRSPSSMAWSADGKSASEFISKLQAPKTFGLTSYPSSYTLG
jgi:hypothetical protein